MIARTHVIAMSSLLAAMLVASTALYARLPDPAPVHWGLHGQADGFGPRWALAAMLPACAAVVAGLMVVLPLLGPHSIERSGRTYGRICVAIVVMLAAMHGVVLAKALGAPVRVEVVAPCAFGVLLAVLGNWMGKVRRNFWVGIRTPWTLASDAVWERTHRLGGRLFVAVGLLIAAVALLGRPVVTFAVLLSGVAALVAWSLAYSMWLYRRVGHADGL